MNRPVPGPPLPRTAFIALGSNLGDTLQNIRKAINSLEQISQRPLICSSLWRTAPIDCPPGSAPFINAVVSLAPNAEETPESLLLRLQKIEQEFGRRPKIMHNESRPLDLDLIAFGSEVRNTQVLILPHPRAHQRSFVMAPLNEIAPDLILPLQSRPVGALLADLDCSGDLLEKL